MYKSLKLLIFNLFFFVCGYGQKLKFDSTLKIGKVGYKVNCSNKKLYSNILSLRLVGFTSDRSKDFSFEIKGRLLKADIDDLNNDGFPDLVLYIYADSNKSINPLALNSDKNESISPIEFPDIRNDLKLNMGYKGYDNFNLIEGNLFRTYPIINSDSTTKNEPTKYQHLIYRVVNTGDRYLKFKIIRSYISDKL